MHLQIITPTGNIYEGEVKLIQLPGLDGSFEVLENHAPLVSGLKDGNIRIIDNADKPRIYKINGGVVEVLKNVVSVVVTQ